MLSPRGGPAAQVVAAVAAAVAVAAVGAGVEDAGVGAVCPGTGPAGRDESEPEPEPEPGPGPDRGWGCVRAAAAGLGDAPSRSDVMPVLCLCGASAAALARLALEPVPVLGLAPLLNSVLNIANRIGYGYSGKLPHPGQTTVTMYRQRRQQEAGGRGFCFLGHQSKVTTRGKVIRPCELAQTTLKKAGEGPKSRSALRQHADEYRKAAGPSG